MGPFDVDLTQIPDGGNLSTGEGSGGDISRPSGTCLYLPLYFSPRFLFLALVSPSDAPDRLIRIKYHPRSKQTDTLTVLEEFYGTVAQDQGSRTVRSDGRPPWFPFRTEEDFEFTKLSVRMNIGYQEIQDLLQFTKTSSDGPSNITLRDYREMFATMDKAANLHTPVS